MLKKRIIINIEEFANKIIDFIIVGPKVILALPNVLKKANENKEDGVNTAENMPVQAFVELDNIPLPPDDIEEPPPAALIKAIERARERYKEKGYGYSNHRLPEFDSLITDINRYKRIMSRLDAIAVFIAGGHVAHNSANSFLLLEMINAMGYIRDNEETDSYLVETVLTPLSSELYSMIDTALSDYFTVLKNNQAQKHQLEAICAVKLQDLPQVMLFDDAKKAKSYKALYADKEIFSLKPLDEKNQNNSFWQLRYYDLRGNANFLPIKKELSDVLKLEKTLPEPTTDFHNQLKNYCHSLLAMHSEVYLFTDDKETADFARYYPNKYSFYVRNTSENTKMPHWHVTRYDSQGKPIVLSYEGECNALKLWAKSTLPATSECNHYKIKQVFADCLKKLFDKVVIEFSQNSESYVHSMPTSTFVVAQLDEKMTLDWYDSLGMVQPISLLEHPILADWLNRPKEWLDKNAIKLKTYLLNLNVRREVDTKKQGNISDMLQKKHGATVLITNAIEKMPSYKLITGTYFLTRYPLQPYGSWLLYQRQKGRVNKLIDTNDWGLFNETLNDCKLVMPEQLTSSMAEQLKKMITTQLAIDNQQNTAKSVESKPINLSDYQNITKLFAINPKEKNDQSTRPNDQPNCGIDENLQR